MAAAVMAERRPGERLWIAAEDNVSAAAGHIGGDSDGAVPAGLGDDLRLRATFSGLALSNSN